MAKATPRVHNVEVKLPGIASPLRAVIREEAEAYKIVSQIGSKFPGTVSKISWMQRNAKGELETGHLLQ